MRATQNAAINQAAKEKSQFELTTNIITKLNTYNLTPTAKLVLLYLTTCYNPKHKEVFPKQRTIADKLGVSERSVTRAIQELFKEGLVLIECKYTNIYKFTSKIVSECAQNLPDNMSEEKGQNDIQQYDNLSHPYIEQTTEHDKEPTGSIKGGNVYNENEILAQYALKHNAKNVNAYVRKLKETGSATKIIKEYKAKNYATKKALRSIEETQSLLIGYENMRADGVSPTLSWIEFGQKIKALRSEHKAAVN